MKFHNLAWLAPLLLAGCNVPAWGNMFVLAITLALFCATVTLGRHVSATPSAPTADQKTAQE